MICLWTRRISDSTPRNARSRNTSFLCCVYPKRRANVVSKSYLVVGFTAPSSATSSRQLSLHSSHILASSHTHSGLAFWPFPFPSCHLLLTFSVRHHAHAHAHGHGCVRDAHVVVDCSLTFPQALPHHHPPHCRRCRCRLSPRSLRRMIRLPLEVCDICSTLDLSSAEITRAKSR